MNENVEEIEKILSKYTKEDIEFSLHFDKRTENRPYLNKEFVKNQIFDFKKLKWYEDQSEKHKEKRFLLVYKLSGVYDFAIVIVINDKLKVITAFKREIKTSDKNRRTARMFLYKKENVDGEA